jgi:hypothetical protein
MDRLADTLSLLLTVFWVGSLWAVGYVVAPTLFSALPDTALAGLLAGRMFGWIAYAGMACGIYLICYRIYKIGLQAFRQWVMWITFFMLVLTLAGHFGIQPVLASLRSQPMAAEALRAVVEERFATWHGIASGLYLLQSLLGLALVLKSLQLR